MGTRSRSPAGDLYTLSTTTTAAGIGAANIPRAAMTAEGAVHSTSHSFTRDGTTPTTTVGTFAYPDDIIILNSRDEVEGLSVRTISGTGTIDWEFFTDVSG